ncbi:DNA (cytosine-5-)-methyltransferase [Mycobacteroides franklinii]|uniref:Cytosine-specific methyltransferase n=1 Tax=Mycobacteroides franklinii TaxID=948102 RepID=A0A1S1LA03_9MYCO|nr:DNA cytosine methyltransferase [Mycobacteroides franklinii]OHU20890.1 DNA (cytosine-5-)-methyltransferase [Mycobacteroides franklinii]
MAGSGTSSCADLRVLDLFSGAGGLSTGFGSESTRFKTVRAIEHDVAAAATYAENYDAEAVFAGGIEEWLKAEDPPEADIVIGGPPCQGFSALGKQEKLDERNQLWLRYAEVIRRSKPKYFVLENVPQFLTSVQFSRFKRQCQPSERLGEYTFQAKVLNAADFGAAQVRKRVILIGRHRDLPVPGFPATTHARVADDGHQKWCTLQDVIGDLRRIVTDIDLPCREVEVGGTLIPGAFKTSELHLTRHYEQLSINRFHCIPADGNRFDIPEELLSECWKKHKSGSGDVMGRLNWNKPSVTIRTEFFKPEKGRYLHPTEHRAITHHEAARIQGFSDDYKWIGSKVAIARQIGNAVPIPLARAIASHLIGLF